MPLLFQDIQFQSSKPTCHTGRYWLCICLFDYFAFNTTRMCVCDESKNESTVILYWRQHLNGSQQFDNSRNSFALLQYACIASPCGNVHERHDRLRNYRKLWLMRVSWCTRFPWLELGTNVEISTWIYLHVEAQNLNACKVNVDSRLIQACI